MRSQWGKKCINNNIVLYFIEYLKSKASIFSNWYCERIEVTVLWNWGLFLLRFELLWIPPCTFVLLFGHFFGPCKNYWVLSTSYWFCQALFFYILVPFCVSLLCYFTVYTATVILFCSELVGSHQILSWAQICHTVY